MDFRRRLSVARRHKFASAGYGRHLLTNYEKKRKITAKFMYVFSALLEKFRFLRKTYENAKKVSENHRTAYKVVAVRFSVCHLFSDFR